MFLSCDPDSRSPFRFRSLGAVLGSVFLLIAAARIDAQPSVVGTLPEDLLPGLRPILQSAMAQSPQMLQQGIAIAQADANELTALSVRWPSLSAFGSYGGSEASVDSAGGTSTSSSSGAYYSLSSGIRIFEFGAINAGINIARIGTQIAEQQHDEAYRTLLLTLRAQYLDLIVRKTGVRNARFVVEQRRADLEDTERRIATNELSPGAINEPQVQLLEAEVAVEQTQYYLDTARRVFMRLAGISSLPDAAIPDTVPVPPAPSSSDALYSSFVGGGIEQTPQARQLESIIRRSELELFIANRRLLPKFSIGAGTGISNNTSVGVDTGGNARVSQAEVTSSNISISGSWSIFDGFATRAAKEQARVAIESGQLQLQNYIDNTTDRVTDLRAQMRIARINLEITERRLGLVRSQLQLYLDAVPATPAMTVAGARANVNNAETIALSARGAYLNLWSEFVSLVGADPAMDSIPSDRGR
jgi:outer membrane protein TolC